MMQEGKVGYLSILSTEIILLSRVPQDVPVAVLTIQTCCS